MSGVEVQGLFFLDTNIFAYSFDSLDLQKQGIALTLIHQALQSQRGVISTQVIQEFLNNWAAEVSTAALADRGAHLFARSFAATLLAFPICAVL